MHASSLQVADQKADSNPGDSKGDDDFVTRDQQLKFKQTKKDKGKRDKKGKGKKAKGKKGKNGKGPSPKKSRKRQILSAGSQPDAVAKKSKKGKVQATEVEVDDSEMGTPPVSESSSPRTAKLAKAKAKAKAKTDPNPRTKTAAAKRKAKASPAPKRKPRGRAVRLPGSELMSNPLRKNSLVKALMDFAKKFPASLEENEKQLKRAVLDELSPLGWCKLMPYWSRNGCGVKVMNDDWKTYYDLHSFTFQSSSAPRRYKLAIAVRCAEIAATRIKPW